MASSATVGSAVVKLQFDGKDVKSELQKTEKAVESTGSKIGSKMKSVGSTVAKALTAAFAAGTAAAVAFGTKAIEAFNTQEEALAKLEQSAKNQNWAEGATKDLMAYNAELQKTGIIGDEVAAAGQAQLGTFGLSAEAVKKLTPAMNDLIAATSGFNASTDSATSMANLMGKVMTGSVSALTRYGVTLSDNQKKLLEEGDEMQRASVLAEVLAQNYGGFNEALAKTPQGQIKQLGNAFGDLKESFGAVLAGKGEMTDFFDNLSSFAGQASKTIGAMAPEFIKGISQLIGTIAKDLPKLLVEITPVLVDGLVQMAASFMEAVPDFLQATVDIILAIQNALIENLPVIIEGVVNMLIEIANTLTNPDNLSRILQNAVRFWMTLVQALPQVLTALINALPQIITNIVSFLLDPANLAMIIDGAVQLFFGLVLAVPQILGSLLGAFGTLVGNLWDGITQMFGQFAANFGDFIGGIFKGAINGVITFIENFVNIPIDTLNGFIGIINGAFGWIGVNLGYIDRIRLPRLATGGIAVNATTALIGEEGKEAVLPLENNTDNWAGLLASILVDEMEDEGLNGGSGVTIEKQEFYINNKMDAEDIGRVMMQSIRRAA